MKYLPFKILIFCIILPPILYLGTILGIDRHYTQYYKREINNIYLTDMNAILNGTVGLREAIQRSIGSFLENNILVDLGMVLDITISTNDGAILYPPEYVTETQNDLTSVNPLAVAKQNFRMLSNGLVLTVEANIPPLSVLGLLILMIYVLISSTGLYVYYYTISKKVHREDSERMAELERLRQLEDEFNQQIATLSIQRERLLVEYGGLKESLDEQKKRAALNEEEMFDELEQLELKLKENLYQQKQQAIEILALESKIGDLEKLKENIDKQKEKNAEKLSRRFKTLYKNIEVDERALEGLSDLTEDMALKAEELVHQLNADPSAVPVKRKVFSKKGNVTAFEVVFSYNGRLYFRKNDQQRVEVLAIGTKNTQNRDLGYLDRLAG